MDNIDNMTISDLLAHSGRFGALLAAVVVLVVDNYHLAADANSV